MSRCRSCNSSSMIPFIDYGKIPLPNCFVEMNTLSECEQYPLKLVYCPVCHLVQIDQHVTPEIVFNHDYKYFSSYSKELAINSKNFFEQICEELKLKKKDRIIEIASNDGYQLKYFLMNHYDNILGIEPTKSTAEVAIDLGIETRIEFFTHQLGMELGRQEMAKLIIANNVLAHVPDLNDFVMGIKSLLSVEGTAVIKFQYIVDLIKNEYFDLIYHEHISYFSLTSVSHLMVENNLRIYKVTRLDEQGGSLEIRVCHLDSHIKTHHSVEDILEEESQFGIRGILIYKNFANSVENKKKLINDFMNDLKTYDKKIAAYGAPAKGNVFLNYLGINQSIIEFTVDRNKEKHRLRMSGSNIPVYDVEKISEEKPDYLVILPWNLKKEIIFQNEYIRTWNGKFVVLMPDIEII